MRDKVKLSEITRLCFGTLIRVIALILLFTLMGTLFVDVLEYLEGDLLIKDLIVNYTIALIFISIIGLISYVIFPYCIIKWLINNHNIPVDCE